jgi:hypothetical protein
MANFSASFAPFATDIFPKSATSELARWAGGATDSESYLDSVAAATFISSLNNALERRRLETLGNVPRGTSGQRGTILPGCLIAPAIPTVPRGTVSIFRIFTPNFAIDKLPLFD